MPYQKHIWVSKEIIRREYLQNIEDGIYNEEQRAIEAENSLQTQLDSESGRATSKENQILGSLTEEVNRASSAESQLAESILDETARATSEEESISANLSNEVSRASSAENTIANNLSMEVTRATAVENDLNTRLENVETQATRAYKASGSIFFADLPQLSENRIGNVYNIKDDFVTTADFIEGAGKSYTEGTNVAIEQIEEINYTEVEPVGDENPSEEIWYEYDETEDEYVLSQDTTVDLTKTYYVRTEYALYYDIPSGFIDTSDFVTNTDYATSSNAGIVKPDGTTITVDNDGTIHSGGSQITVDDAISSTSENPVQNKVIYAYIDTMITQAITSSY